MANKELYYKLAHLPDKFFLKVSELKKGLLRTFNRLLDNWARIFNIEKFSPGFKKARLISFPLSYIWIFVWKKSKKKQVQPILTDTPGFHIVGGNTGEGKSSFAFELAERDRILKGKPWYFNTEIEKPRFYAPLSAFIKHHRVIPFNNVWSAWKMHIQLNKHLYSAYLIDELHRIFDYRQNMTTEYLSRFEPFRDYAVLSRKHIGRIFGITQMDRLDIQLMYLVKYWHKPKIDIGVDYEDWMFETGLFRFKPLGWFVDTYTVDTSNSSNMLREHSSWYLKNEYADMDYFDTYAFSDAYNHVPMDQSQK